MLCWTQSSCAQVHANRFNTVNECIYSWTHTNITGSHTVRIHNTHAMANGSMRIYIMHYYQRCINILFILILNIKYIMLQKWNIHFSHCLGVICACSSRWQTDFRWFRLIAIRWHKFRALDSELDWFHWKTFSFCFFIRSHVNSALCLGAGESFDRHGDGREGQKQLGTTDWLSDVNAQKGKRGDHSPLAKLTSNNLRTQSTWSTHYTV